VQIKIRVECMLSDFQITLNKVYRTYGVIGLSNKKMGALDVRCLYEIHTIRYLNYLLNISHDFIYIIGSRSIWILGSLKIDIALDLIRQSANKD
jgi:hypothetical protein